MEIIKAQEITRDVVVAQNTVMQPVGMVCMYVKGTPPYGWLNCDGSAVSRTIYSDLFTITSTQYGSGDGSTTFNLPDFRGGAPVGYGTSQGYTQNETFVLGQKYDDQFQGHAHGGLRWGLTNLAGGDDTGYIVPGAVGKSTPSGNITSGTLIDANGAVRLGNTTRGKVLGINFIIKALNVYSGSQTQKVPIITGSGAPTMPPDFVGQQYIDTTIGNQKSYLATGMGSTSNWLLTAVGDNGFTKDTIPGCVFWIKANTGLTKDGGDLVSQWNDLSSSGWNLTEATNKPKYFANVIGSNPVVRFDGINQKLQNAIASLNQPMTVFIVGRAIALATDKRIVSFGSNAIPLFTRASNFTLYAGSEFNGATRDTNNHIWMSIINNTASTLKTDASVSTGTIGTNSMAGIQLAWDTTTAYYNCDIAEILIFNSSLSSANQTIVNTYLNNKYAIY